ncbi:MAG: hypothetical protein JW841_16940 [Deltaproteobacteria bacterium]|nr:hypothetical protein [Deltaproteobacteria bacterium]
MAKQLPKHLIPILGKPVLYWLLLAIQQSSCCPKVCIIVKNKNSFKDAIAKLANNFSKLTIVTELVPFNVKGPWQAMGYILQKLKHPAFFMSGDLIMPTAENIKTFQQKCQNAISNYEALIAGGICQPMETASGLVVDRKKKLIGFERYNPYTGQQLVNVGCCVMTPRISEMLITAGKYAYMHKDEDYVLRHLAKRGATQVAEFRQSFVNVNTVPDCMMAERLLSGRYCRK